MKKNLLALLALTIVSTAFTQNNRWEIDYKTEQKIPDKIDISKPLTINLKNCDVITNSKFILEIIKEDGGLASVELKCNKDNIVSLQQFFTSKKEQITLTIPATGKDGKDRKQAAFVDPSGSMGVAFQKEKEEPETKAELPEYSHNFVDPNFLAPVYTSTATSAYPQVLYNPCNNITKLSLNADTTNANALKFYEKFNNNGGVVFLIKDFNTLKYDITVTDVFENRFTDEPAMFKAVYKLMAPADFIQSGAKKEEEKLKDELSRINKLNKDLKGFIESKMKGDDCASFVTFEKEKKAIAENIQQEFNKHQDLTKPLSFDAPYQIVKTALMDANKNDSKFSYNTYVQELFSMPITPDSLVSETRKLLHLVMSTKFEYQYNVPKLENADMLNFTLNIKPKEGSTGTLVLKDRLIPVPIKRGLKVDFSTGLYYSTIRSPKYSLKDVYTLDSLIGKDIIEEDGNYEEPTGGITAQMHIYPRVGSFQPAFTFGVGGSLDLNYSLLFGATVLIGRENRFGISGGLNYSSIKLISGKYIEDGSFIRQQKDTDKIDTYNAFKRGWFLSFTYSLGPKKTQQAAPVKEDPGKNTTVSENEKPDDAAAKQSENKNEEAKDKKK